MGLEEDYLDLGVKIKKAAEDYGLEANIFTSDYPITITFNRAREDQMRIGETDEQPRETALTFIYGEEQGIDTKAAFSITSEQFKKLKGISDKLHYVYLQMYFMKRMDFERAQVKETEIIDGEVDTQGGETFPIAEAIEGERQLALPLGQDPVEINDSEAVYDLEFA